MGHSSTDPAFHELRPWNEGRLIGAKRALKQQQVWAIRFWLDQHTQRCKIFPVRHLLHPGHGSAVVGFMDGDMSHASMRRRAMPVLVFGGAPQDVARTKLQLRSTRNLGPANTLGHDQRLTRGVGVPRGTRTGLEVNDGPRNARRLIALELTGDGGLLVM